MPYPTKDPELQNRMITWIQKNPDRWFTAKYEDIQVEADVSYGTLYRHFPLLVAREANIKPSEVTKKRQEQMGIAPMRRKLSADEIAEIERLFTEGNTTLDVAFATGRSPRQCDKYKPEHLKKKRGKRKC